MGLCSSCFKGTSSDSYVTPDMELRRRQQVEAAERRQREQENRGIKDPEKVKRMQQKAENLERLEREAAKSSTDAPLKGLKWLSSYKLGRVCTKTVLRARHKPRSHNDGK